MNALEELKERTGGTDGATPLEWAIICASEHGAERANFAAAELAVMREALGKIAHTHNLNPRLSEIAYGYQQIARAALKGETE